MSDDMRVLDNLKAEFHAEVTRLISGSNRRGDVYAFLADKLGKPEWDCHCKGKTDTNRLVAMVDALKIVSGPNKIKKFIDKRDKEHKRTVQRGWQVRRDNNCMKEQG
jgi:hypothetical protein